jgi:hypothetical protein
VKVENDNGLFAYLKVHRQHCTSHHHIGPQLKMELLQCVKKQSACFNSLKTKITIVSTSEIMHTSNNDLQTTTQKNIAIRTHLVIVVLLFGSTSADDINHAANKWGGFMRQSSKRIDGFMVDVVETMIYDRRLSQERRLANLHASPK